MQLHSLRVSRKKHERAAKERNLARNVNKKCIKISRTTENDAFYGPSNCVRILKILHNPKRSEIIFLSCAITTSCLMKIEGEIKLMLFIFAIRGCHLAGAVFYVFMGEWMKWEWKNTAKCCTSSMSFYFAFKRPEDHRKSFWSFLHLAFARLERLRLVSFRALERESWKKL